MYFQEEINIIDSYIQKAKDRKTLEDELELYDYNLSFLTVEEVEKHLKHRKLILEYIDKRIEELEG